LTSMSGALSFAIVCSWLALLAFTRGAKRDPDLVPSPR
jgi:hypothetical protein